MAEYNWVFSSLGAAEHTDHVDDDEDDEDSTSSLLEEHSRSGILVDFPDDLYYDDAACFNTEAFSHRAITSASDSVKVDADDEYPPTDLDVDVNDDGSNKIESEIIVAQIDGDDDDDIDDFDKDPDFIADLEDEQMNEVDAGDYTDEQSGDPGNISDDLGDVECDLNDAGPRDDSDDDAMDISDGAKIVGFEDIDDEDAPVCEADCGDIDFIGNHPEKSGNDECSDVDDGDDEEEEEDVDETLCEKTNGPNASGRLIRNSGDAESSNDSLDDNIDGSACAQINLVNPSDKNDTDIGETGSLGDVWSIDDDRRLLEFCRSTGKASLKVLNRLAEKWPEHPADDLAARFKYLMRIGLGVDYASDICDSSSSEEEEEDNDDAAMV